MPREAAELYLQALARRTGIGAIALGDDQGSVIAGVGEPSTVTRLAHAGADSAADRQGWRQQVDDLGEGGPFFSLRMAAGEWVLRLSGLGNALLCRQAVEESLGRIFGPGLVPAEG